MLLQRQALAAGRQGWPACPQPPVGQPAGLLGRQKGASQPRLTPRASMGVPPGGNPDEEKSAQGWIDNWREKQGEQPLFPADAAAPAPAPAQPPAAAPAAAAAAAGAAVPAPAQAGAPTSQQELAQYAQMWAGLGVMYAVDVAVKAVLASQGIKFPGPLVGMFGVVVALLAVDDKTADKVLAWFGPSLQWIAKWLPLFYVASLVTLPLNLSGISGNELAKIFGILSIGMVGTLIFTAQTAVSIRAIVKTENKEVGKAKAATPFLISHWAAWGAVAATSLVATLAAPTTLGPQMALPFNLAATLMGFLLGNAMPKAVQAVLHPVVMTALVANAGAALHGSLTSLSYEAAQRAYYTKCAASMGAGDVLMSFLGVVIISMGFRIYQQRDTMKRHAPEIVGATLLSSLFSFFSTAFAAKALGLSAELARALIPRSVTVALALPISAQLDAPAAITAAAVLLQGMLGANFGPSIMSALGYKDTISRGLAAAATAGGLGTASLTSKEPEALPFCALSYSMVGIISTFLATTPWVRAALTAIVA